ncbi:MAG: endolytic transglycosylase MltG [Parcubacteria group bacterium]|nr:endolytic transglycosylase MltG [Parcubacteria group bacterium]MCR4342646.1 endolytic transglycosylase MltG [Patescibacteria group bacterium]
MSLTFNNILKDSDEYNPYGNNHKIIIIVLGIFLFLSSVLIYFLAFSPPSGFDPNEIIVVRDGSSLGEVAIQLKENEIIKSEFVFKIIVRFLGGQRGVKSGNYFFKEPQNVLTVARRVVGADFRITPVRVTIPEGSTIDEISKILQNLIDDFDKEDFFRLTKGQIFFDNNISDKPFDSLEGFLFPDTYFFLPNIKNFQIVNEMRRNFNLKITPEIKEEIERRELSVYEVITMASLIEEEARLPETRRIVSGILWKRLNAGMALQVDAVFPYIIGKNTFEITLDDLKIDSPYNTYLYKGLPKGPISSPGLDSILATVYPKDSDYWYYLSDKEGNMHYAKTFEEHKANKEKYLR